MSYIVGVFAKDKTDGAEDTQAFERVLDNFGRAVHHLDSFGERRVGAAVAACARLNLNELDPLHAATGVTAVDLISRFLGRLAAHDERPAWPEPPHSQASELRCPVDEATFSLLELVFELGQEEHVVPLDEHLDRIEYGNLTSPDRAKFAIVVGEWADRQGNRETARRCATVLYNDPVFGAAVERWSS